MKKILDGWIGMKFLPWFGAITGIIGAVLLALHLPISKFGYIGFCCSSIALAVWALHNSYRHQLLMNCAFTVINAIGLYRWLIT